MASFVKEIPEEDFARLTQALEHRPMINNPDRRVSGAGRSQALGIIKRWAYRPWVSRITWMYPELWREIQAFAEKHITIPWTAVQVNENYQSKPHKDVGNRGESSIVAFGNYTGGELVVEGTPIDIRHRLHTFNGSELQHWNNPIQGKKYTLVFFNWDYPSWWPESSGLPTISTTEIDGKIWVQVDDIDGAIYHLRGRKERVVRKPQFPVARVGKVVGKGGKAIQAVPQTSDLDDHSGAPPA